MSAPQREHWIPIKDAAVQAGYSADYFRRTFCNSENPILRIRVLSGGRILVSSLAVEAMIQGQIRGPEPVFRSDPQGSTGNGVQASLPAQPAAIRWKVKEKP